MNRRLLMACLCLMAIPLFALDVLGQTPGDLKCIVTESGEYVAATAEEVRTPGTSSGTSRRIDLNSVKFTTRSQEVVAKAGVRFGLRFTVSGLPGNTRITFRKVVTHPEMHKPDGTTSKGYVVDQNYTTSAEGVVTGVEGYGLDLPYELVTGKWRFEIWYGDHKLAEEEYTVVKEPS
jgi:Domain of unknown function (DUF3859)